MEHWLIEFSLLIEFSWRSSIVYLVISYGLCLSVPVGEHNDERGKHSSPTMSVLVDGYEIRMN